MYMQQTWRSDHVSNSRLQEVKNNENYNAVTSKSGRGRLREVPTKGFDWEILSILDRWSLIGGGRLQVVVAH